MSTPPLEPTSEQRRALGHAVVDFVNDWLDQRPDAPASWPEPDPELIEQLLQSPPEDGRPIEELLTAIDRGTRSGFDTAGGGFLSYIPSGGLYAAALGSLIGAVTNQYTGGAHASPATTAIEESVIRWLADVFGLPRGAGGVLLSGGSIANQIAVVTARTQLGDRFDDGVVYASARVHHSIEKAARTAGIATDRIRLVETDSERRLDPSALMHHIAADVANGLRPMVIVANAGTTDTGAIDPLHECADIAVETGAWFHVDGAYGAFFQLTERGRSRLAGIERGDSITIDAHKSLFLPFGIGGLLVRDRAPVIEAHEGAGAYMQDIADGALPHYWEMGPELTRPNRGVQAWLALNLHGVARFRDELDRMLDLAERAAAALGGIAGIELLTDPPLSVVGFRARVGDEATDHILDALLASREVHVSSTTIDGQRWVRFAFLSPRTTDAIVDRAIEIVASAVD